MLLFKISAVWKIWIYTIWVYRIKIKIHLNSKFCWKMLSLNLPQSVYQVQCICRAVLWYLGKLRDHFESLIFVPRPLKYSKSRYLQIKVDMAILRVVNMFICISKSYNKVVTTGILPRAILWFCIFKRFFGMKMVTFLHLQPP